MSSSSSSSEMIMDDIQPNIGLSEEDRRGLAGILNNRLCDEYTLTTKTKKYYWNVIGPRFHQLHEFLEEQYKTVDKLADETAERARRLGVKSLGTQTEMINKRTATSELKEDPGDYPDSQTMISNLLTDHEKAVQTLRKDAMDVEEKYHSHSTSDFLLDSVQIHEEMAWMLRGHLEKEKGGGDETVQEQQSSTK
jgi:starvation-inducible DNA-binding protein